MRRPRTDAWRGAYRLPEGRVLRPHAFAGLDQFWVGRKVMWRGRLVTGAPSCGMFW
jgi:hypothetical protein